MERARKTFSFSDGREVEVFESTWEAGEARAAIEARAKAEKAKLNGSGDPVYFYFLESFYSYLSSCSSGSVPTETEAFGLSDPDLDAWYLATVEVNPESFLPVDFKKRKEVVFRDGSILTIVSSYLPSVTMRRVRLEEEALRREEDRDHPKDVFGVYLYPILASCSIGEIPSPEEIRSTWPESQIYKWRDAVEEVNPHWFGSSEDMKSRTLQETQEVEKKRDKSRRKSSAS